MSKVKGLRKNWQIFIRGLKPINCFNMTYADALEQADSLGRTYHIQELRCLAAQEYKEEVDFEQSKRKLA